MQGLEVTSLSIWSTSITSSTTDPSTWVQMLLRCLFHMTQDLMYDYDRIIYYSGLLLSPKTALPASAITMIKVHQLATRGQPMPIL